MIYAALKDVKKQPLNPPLMKKALDFLRRPDLCDLPDGEVEIEARRVFAIVQRYKTVETDFPEFEFHKKHIDIQYVVSGDEAIGWSTIDRLAVTEAYDADKDAGFGTVRLREWTSVCLSAGQFAVFYPTDVHAPKMAWPAPMPVMKIVVKVRVRGSGYRPPGPLKSDKMIVRNKKKPSHL